MNSADVMRMLHRLRQPQDFQLEPEAAPAPERKPRAPRKKREPSPDSEYSDSDSESDGYEELQQIKDHYEKEPCEYVSPAGLNATKTKKEAIKYLEEKKCPKIKSIKKAKMESPKAPPMSESPTVKEKKVRAKKVVADPAPVQVVVPPAPKKVTAKKAVAPPAPAADPVVVPEKTEKKKRAPTAYAQAVGRHRKAGLSFAEAAKAAKAECDAAKAK
jgi:hypothetical protein